MRYNNASDMSCFNKLSVFGNRMPVVQRLGWIFAMYKNRPEFGFKKLEGLIKDGTCKAIK